MADETVEAEEVTTADVAAETTQETTEAAVSVADSQEVEATEKVKETDWREDYLSTIESKEEKAAYGKFLRSYDGIGSLVKAAKTVIDKQRDGKTIDALDEDATPEEKAKALKALGFTIPEKVEDFKVAAPEGLELDEESNEMLDRFVNFSHETKIPQEYAQKISEWFWNEQASAAQKIADTVEEIQERSLADLKNEWSSKREFNENTEYANEAIKYAFGDKFQDMKDLRFEGGMRLGDNPEFIRAFARVGRVLGEDGTIVTPVTADATKSAEGKLDELMKLPRHEYNKPEIQRQVDELTAIVARRKATVQAA